MQKLAMLPKPAGADKPLGDFPLSGLGDFAVPRWG